jgi:hypothetical protein
MTQKSYATTATQFGLTKLLKIDVKPLCNPARLCFQFVNNICDKLSPAAVYTAACDTLGIEPHEFMVVWKNDISLGHQLSSKLFLRSNQLCPCRCAEFHEIYKQDGHLLSHQADWADKCSDAVRLAVNIVSVAGLNHRPVRPHEPTAVLDEYMNVLLPFISTTSKLHTDLISDALTAAFHWLYDTTNFPAAEPPCDFARLQAGIQELRTFCFVLPSDKAKNQPIFMCRQLAVNLVRSNLLHSGCYAPIPEPDVASFVQQVHSHITTVQFPDVVKWATMFPLFKPHKRNFRFITDCAGIFVTEFSILILKMVTAVFNVQCAYCRDLCREIANVHGLHIRLDNVVTDYITASLNFPKQCSVPTLYTGDIEKCYDVIPINLADPHSIPSRLKFVLQVIVNSTMPDVSFQVRRRSAIDWSVILAATPIAGYSTIPLLALPGMVELLLSHCYIHSLGSYWKITSGCPQGLPPCPVLVNNHLLSYDVEFVLFRMSYAQGRWEIMQLYTCMMKLMDDLAVCGGHQVHELLRKVYPPYIVIKITSGTQQRHTEKIQHGSFVGMNIHMNESGVISLTTADKTDALPFIPVRYVQAAANRSRRFGVKIILGQILPTVVLNSSRQDAAAQFRKLVCIFVDNGFRPHEIKHAVDKYLQVTDLSGIAQYDVIKAWKHGWFTGIKHRRRRESVPG